MNKINLKTYFKKRKQRISVTGISPIFDWWFILSILGTVFLFGVGYAIYLYIHINNNSIFETISLEDPGQETESQKLKIKKVVEEIENRNFDESLLN